MTTVAERDDSPRQLTDHRRATGLDSCTCGGMRVVGYVPATRRTRSDCEQPLRAVCRECDRVEEWRCGTYGCGPCGEAKRRVLERVIEDGAGVQANTGLLGYFVTLTAPGVNDHLRWYQGTRPSTRPICECHNHGSTLAAWNAGESACWNRLRTALTRDTYMQFAGSVEVQDGKRGGTGRGALHRHVLIFTDVPMTHEHVQELALAAGYGCVLDLEPIDSARKAARYLSKYVSKASTSRQMVPWEKETVDRSTGEIHSSRKPTYRLWSSSRHWGVTARQVRDAHAQQARQRAMYLRELEALLGVELQAGGQRQERPTNAESTSDPP